MFTQNPWHARVTETVNGAPAEWQIRDAYGVIATVESVNPDDARLIAAAPALLAALHAVLDDIDADRAAGIEPPDWYWVACEAAALAAPDDIDEAAEQERNQYAHDDR